MSNYSNSFTNTPSLLIPESQLSLSDFSLRPIFAKTRGSTPYNRRLPNIEGKPSIGVAHLVTGSWRGCCRPGDPHINAIDRFLEAPLLLPTHANSGPDWGRSHALRDRHLWSLLRLLQTATHAATGEFMSIPSNCRCTFGSHRFGDTLRHTKHCN